MAGKAIKKKCPKCPFKHNDCFALVMPGHLCFILENTEFKPDKDCPFYKPEEKTEEETNE